MTQASSRFYQFNPQSSSSFGYSCYVAYPSLTQPVLAHADRRIGFAGLFGWASAFSLCALPNLFIWDDGLVGIAVESANGWVV